MKYLLVIAFILVVFWLWRHNRQVENKAHQTPPARGQGTPAKPLTEMVACPVCRVHLPKSEALRGRKQPPSGPPCRKQKSHPALLAGSGKYS